MFVPFGSRALPPSWALSVYSRSLLRHPSRRSNNTLDSWSTRSPSLAQPFSSISSLSPTLRFLPFPTSSFHLSCSMALLIPKRHDRIFFLCAFLKYSENPYMCTVTISRYCHCRKHWIFQRCLKRGSCPFLFFFPSREFWLSSWDSEHSVVILLCSWLLYLGYFRR